MVAACISTTERGEKHGSVACKIHWANSKVIPQESLVFHGDATYFDQRRNPEKETGG